ncbi:telomerase protein component 1-like [Pelobates fuscus]|uniref:telomerase protein component 1-like n=1 Tax=Pelobates fuscus TaxID=191477 RepID=UPI002FE43122
MGIVVSKPRATKKDGQDGAAKHPAFDVSQMWDEINSLPPVKLPDSSLPPVNTGWTTVRVFVSSTFEDFNSEREVLIKQVFPALREWCESLSMCLVECDLRWGIPQDTPSGKILNTCLGELDRCHQDTRGTPLMVILLGQRAGWVPSVSEIPEDIMEQYSWINGMSVTGSEILHGAYRNRNPNAAFCLRDPSYLDQVALHELPRYQEEGWSALMLQSLKEQVCKRFPEEQILKYKCQVLGTDTSTGIDKVKLGFSDDFGSWILRFLQARILETFSGDSEVLSTKEKPSWEQIESTQHQLFLWQKQEVFLGRNPEIQRILDFLQMKMTAQQQQHKGSEEGDKNHTIRLYQVIAEPGLGKSSLLTECINRALQLPHCTVFYHFVGCCSSSVQISNIMIRLCYHLLPPGQDRDDALQRLNNCLRNEDMKEILKDLLALFPSYQDKALYIFIDAINQLSVPYDASDLLSWLSTEEVLPPFCRCVISSTQNSVSSGSSYIMHLEPLSLESAQNLAVMYLSRYTKELSSKQLHLLLQKTSSQNPLWLTMACEELRVFGEFKMLTQKIAGFPDTLQGLLENIIQRLVQEDQSARVKELLCLLYCCSESVVEKDLQGSLSYLERGPEIPSMHWATLRRTIKCLIRAGRDHRGRDTLSFFHGSVAKAVEQSFLAADTSRQPYLCSLSDYYENICSDDATVVSHLPRLLQEAKLNNRLVQFLRKDQRAKSIQAHIRAQYLKGLRCSMMCREGFPRKPAMICAFCSLKSGAFGQFFPNSQSCAVCGSHAAYMGKEAFQCPQHYSHGRNDCLVCKNIILGPQSPSPALLCNTCGFLQTCIALKT